MRDRHTLTLPQIKCMLALADGTYRAGMFHGRTIKTLQRLHQIEPNEVVLTERGQRNAARMREWFADTTTPPREGTEG